MMQLKNIATNMEEHRKKINNFTNKNVTLKYEDENISREMRGIHKYAYYIFN